MIRLCKIMSVHLDMHFNAKISLYLKSKTLLLLIYGIFPFDNILLLSMSSKSCSNNIIPLTPS